MRDLLTANNLCEQLNEEWILKDDLEYQDIMKKYIYGDVYQHGQIDLPLRELILIVVNTTNQTLKALKEHILAALRIGVSPLQIKEVIYQCTPYVGLGKVQEALDIVNEVFHDQKIQLPLPSSATVNEETRFEKGFAIQCQAFNQEHIQAGHDHAPKELKHIQNYLSEHCFGDFYTRKGLDLKTRELMTMVMLATLGGCENQLRAHVGANIKVGNTRELLIETITQCQPYIGFPRTLNALQIINEVTYKEDNKMNDKDILFGLGDPNDKYAEYFDGQSYLKRLTTTGGPMANVTFEPGCRNHWHIHHKSGQILLCTMGRGYYQEWGQPAQLLKPGDIVTIPAEVKHWHGATKDSWFTHISVEIPAEGSSNEWLEAVDQKDYNNLR